MRIGIIGVGNIGAALARKFSAAGHDVLIANSRGPDSLKGTAASIGATAVSVEDAATGVDVVVVSIPQGRIPQLPTNLFASLSDEAVVVDTGNYYPRLIDEPPSGFRRDAPIGPVEAGMAESVWVAEQLGRPVIKAFNSILARSLADKGREAGAPGRIALPVAGDDADAKRKVIGLVDDAGFDGVDAGSLGESWRQQPGTPAYCTDLGLDELRRALASADKDSAARKRDLALEKRGAATSEITSEDVIQLNRSLF